MIGRIAISVAVWLVGVFQGFILDGQVFTGSLWLLGSAVGGALPWVPLLSRRHDERRRFFAIVILGLSALVIVSVSLQLPAAYEAQRKFNDRASMHGPGPSP